MIFSILYSDKGEGAWFAVCLWLMGGCRGVEHGIIIYRVCACVCVCILARWDNMKNGLLAVKKIVMDCATHGDKSIPVEMIRKELMQLGFIRATASRKIIEACDVYDWEIVGGYLKV